MADSCVFEKNGKMWWRSPYGEELPLPPWNHARAKAGVMNMIPANNHFTIGLYGPGAREMADAWGTEDHTITYRCTERTSHIDLPARQMMIDGESVQGPQVRRRYCGKFTGETMTFRFSVKFKPGACHRAYWVRRSGEPEVSNPDMWAVGVYDLCMMQDAPFTRAYLEEEIGETMRWVGPISGESDYDPIWCPKPICWFATRKMREEYKEYIATYGFC